jgi:predicted phage terminase large subunit-like protein
MTAMHEAVVSGRLKTSELNREMMEYPGYEGSFRNTTVGGRVVGESLDLGIIDDPIKGREEANSQLIRDKTWDWFTDDFMGCFSKHGALLCIATRWHVDDPIGRMSEQLKGVKVLRYPAIAEKDEKHRRRGEALFPEHKPLAWILERKFSQASFQAIYQQSPIVVGGGIFPIDKVQVLNVLPAKQYVRKAVRYWDKGATANDGDYTAGILMLETKDQQFVVADVRRGQWSSLARERIIKQTAEIDKRQGWTLQTYVEQEPGSGGKESAESTIRNLRGFSIRADKVTGDKETRADPFAAQVQAGNVSILTGNWNRALLDEMEQFPNGKHDDQIDGCSGSFNKLTLESRYVSDYSWV